MRLFYVYSVCWDGKRNYIQWMSTYRSWRSAKKASVNVVGGFVSTSENLHYLRKRYL